MVLSKVEHSQRLQENFNELFIAVERIIDTCLNGHRIPISISTEKITSIIKYYDNKEKFLEFVLSKYRQAGWNCKRERGSDCRNEHWDYIEFS